MKRKQVTEADVAERLAVLNAGQPWSTLGAVATVLAVLVLLGGRELPQGALSPEALWVVALLLLIAGIGLQWVGWRKRKAFLRERPGAR